jgi:nitrous oxide reductase accessory protein NosL
MGHELVPFGRREEAEEFKRDHRGRRLWRFDEVTPALLKSLDGEP